MSLKWRLYDDNGVPNPEKLLMTEQAGGWDGILVSFLEGTDDDTFNMVFPSAYVMRVTRAEADDFDIAPGHSFTWANGELVLRGRLFDDEKGEAYGDVFDTPAEGIIAIGIY